jgi:hypothetical protein
MQQSNDGIRGEKSKYIHYFYMESRLLYVPCMSVCLASSSLRIITYVREETLSVLVSGLVYPSPFANLHFWRSCLACTSVHTSLR